MNLPTDENGLYLLFLFIVVLYVIASYIARKVVTGRFLPRKGRDITCVFDGATCSGSLILLLGIYDPGVLALVGNTKPFLVLAALAGLIYSIHALGPDE